MKFDALLRRGDGIHLLTPGEVNMGSSGSPDGARVKSALTPVLPYIHWWLKEVKEMLPQTLRNFFAEHRLQVRASQGEVCIDDPDGEGSKEVCHALGSQDGSEGYIPAVKQRCDLLLDDSLVLMRELELPFEAEATLRQVLMFSMDRYTPFNENNVFFDYKIVRRDSANKKISLKLYVAPREGVEPVIRKLAYMGIEPVTLDVATIANSGKAGERAGVNLLSPERRPGIAGMGRSNRLLALSALILLLVAVLVPFIQRQHTATELESELSLLRGQVRQAEVDRMELADRLERMRQIRTQSTAMPALLDVLLELTRLIPDDAWAGQVTIKSGRVRLTGEASAASELLAQLSNSSIFSDPKFEAPLTQNPKNGRERFVISLAIKGR